MGNSRSVSIIQRGSAKKSSNRTGDRTRSVPRDLKHEMTPKMKRVAFLFVIWFVVATISAIVYSITRKAEANIPDRAYKYRSFLIRQAHFEYGLDAPIPMFAAQIHQESAWRPEVSSPYADGLTQFTPSTAKWIAEIYPSLGAADVFNPKWAIRAMLKYDKHLYNLLGDSYSECDRWAFTLSSYNGGYGWVKRDKRLALAAGDDPTRWWDHVEKYSNRADWAIEENREYPKRILYRNQQFYIDDMNRWVGKAICRQEDLEKDIVEDTEKKPQEKETKTEAKVAEVKINPLTYMVSVGIFYWMYDSENRNS